MITEPPLRASTVFSTRAVRLALGIALGVTVILCLVTQVMGMGDSLPRLLVMLSCVLSVLYSLTSPVWAGVAVAAIFALVSWFPELRGVAPFVAAVIVIGAVAYRGHYPAATFTLIVLTLLGCTDMSEGTISFSTDGTALILALLMLGSGGVVGGAFGLISRQRQEEKRQIELERQLRREATVRTLHDSVASSLTSAIMRAESLGFEESLPKELSVSVNSISNDIREAMKEIRVLIKYANSDEWPDSEDDEIVESSSRLVSKSVDAIRGHGFEVLTKGDLQLLDQLDVAPRKLRLMLSELVANIVKYGDHSLPVRCEVVKDDQAISLSLSNAIAATQSATYLSSGIGLTDISQAACELGGEFVFGAESGRWISTLRLPVGKVSTFVSTSEILARNT